LPQNYLLDDYIAKEKVYTKKIPSENDEKTIKIGIEAARMLTDIDAGQTVVVKDESVIALEGVEGTDKTILRGGELAGKNCIVVKMARRNQDYRIDIPTIGLETIKKVVEINGRGIVIEADKMLFIDKEEVIKFANKNKILAKTSLIEMSPSFLPGNQTLTHYVLYRQYHFYRFVVFEEF